MNLREWFDDLDNVGTENFHPIKSRIIFLLQLLGAAAGAVTFMILVMSLERV